eukprot:TRINITY_DN96155_c0_g1_i1.p1 TRINITY_DN96155_c0_g1~~TRINITY_DN96155_c0_g1_i1.p1  ORF type:complete len:254 (-),score=-10.87 TRINITY_DN96155_c0_g1_i1:177-938(-)
MQKQQYQLLITGPKTTTQKTQFLIQYFIQVSKYLIFKSSYSYSQILQNKVKTKNFRQKKYQTRRKVIIIIIKQTQKLFFKYCNKFYQIRLKQKIIYSKNINSNKNNYDSATNLTQISLQLIKTPAKKQARGEQTIFKYVLHTKFSAHSHARLSKKQGRIFKFSKLTTFEYQFFCSNLCQHPTIKILYSKNLQFLISIIILKFYQKNKLKISWTSHKQTSNDCKAFHSCNQSSEKHQICESYIIYILYITPIIV